ncbi:MAG: pyridoxal-phosphate dependent enzyme [Chloroflexi bacterium]|nr:pyridoxal-phosphate dependent enzyme [Chloroflexota bacterium]
MAKNSRPKRQASDPDHQLRVYSDITQLIASPANPTPLVRLNRINPSSDFLLFLKLERYNPFGSIKDRIACEMLRGLDIGQKTIVEPSSGNTGIALACTAAALGVPIEIAVPEGIPDEKKILLKLLGAKLLEADDTLCPMYPTEGARGLVKALVESPAASDRYVTPNQYENELNVQAHYRNTGPEIWAQTKGKVDYFFAGFGTCGTITGVARFLKEQNPKVRVIGVEPDTPYHQLPGMKRITDLEDRFVPTILDRSVIDDVVEVTDEDAYATAIDLARKDGIPVGPTTGAIVHVALKYASSHKGLAVAISPDDAFKYASFYKEFLEEAAPFVLREEYDFTGFVCPASKVMATQIVDSLTKGQSTRIILGDRDSLQNIQRELKMRKLTPELEEVSDTRFVLTIAK